MSAPPAKTAIAIKMNISNVPPNLGNYERNLTGDGRHVVLNLDAVVINPKKKNTGSGYEKFNTLETENLDVLKKCHRLYVLKEDEPWRQTYSVVTPAHQRLLSGKSEEEFCFSLDKTEKRVYVYNCKDKGLIRIEFQSKDCGSGPQERTFTIKSLGYNCPERDRKLGVVKLQDVNGQYVLQEIHNEKEGVHFTSRERKDCITILQDGCSPVAIIDLNRSKMLMWTESYMLTFTKEISYCSKALILSSIICYDIAFYRRSDSVKTICMYLLYLIILFSGAAALLACLYHKS